MSSAASQTLHLPQEGNLLKTLLAFLFVSFFCFTEAAVAQSTEDGVITDVTVNGQGFVTSFVLTIADSGDPPSTMVITIESPNQNLSTVLLQVHANGYDVTVEYTITGETNYYTEMTIH